MKRQHTGKTYRFFMPPEELKQVTNGEIRIIITPFSGFNDRDEALEYYLINGGPLGSAWTAARDTIAFTESFYIDDDNIVRYDDGVEIPNFQWKWKRRRQSPAFMPSHITRVRADIKDVDIWHYDDGWIKQQHIYMKPDWPDNASLAWVYHLWNVRKS